MYNTNLERRESEVKLGSLVSNLNSKWLIGYGMIFDFHKEIQKLNSQIGFSSADNWPMSYSLNPLSLETIRRARLLGKCSRMSAESSRL